MDILCSLGLRGVRRHLLRTARRVTVRNAVDLAYKVYGNLGKDPPIIVLHGLLGSKKNWGSLCTKIAQATSKVVVAADIRNHGESPHDSSHSYLDLKADVSQLMNKLNINSAYVIGHSMGGRTAMVLALTEPSKVVKLVVVDISPVPTEGMIRGFIPELLKIMKTAEFTGLNASDARALAKKTLKASGLFENEGFMAFIIMNVGKKHDGTIGWLCNVEVLLKYFSEIAAFPKLDSKYEGPVIFIGGDQSDYLPPGDIDGIRKYFPKASLTYIKGVGHNVHAEDPVTFVSIVESFIKS